MSDAPSITAPAAPVAIQACAPLPVAGRREIGVILKRRDFLTAARADRWSMPGLLMQARRRAPDEPLGTAPRVGFTCSKKVGNAVARNRAKRRLRAAVDAAMPGRALPGWDYVLIGRHDATAARPMPELVADLIKALEVLPAGRGRTAGPPRAKGGKAGKAGFGRGKGLASGADAPKPAAAKPPAPKTLPPEGLAYEGPAPKTLASEGPASKTLASEGPASKTLASEGPASKTLASEGPASKTLVSEGSAPKTLVYEGPAPKPLAP
jgi:ribonuclease P protein component